MHFRCCKPRANKTSLATYALLGLDPVADGHEPFLLVRDERRRVVGGQDVGDVDALLLRLIDRSSQQKAKVFLGIILQAALCYFAPNNTQSRHPSLHMCDLHLVIWQLNKVLMGNLQELGYFEL